MTIEEVIAQDYTLVGTGRFLKGQEHDSLVVDTVKQIFYWNSKKISGDIRVWLQRIKHEKIDFRLNLFDTVQVEEKTPEFVADASLVDIFHQASSATNYWTGYRFYTQKTIDKFKLGYTGEWNTIPIYEDGRFVNFQCRTNTPEKRIKHWYKGVGPHSFNFSVLPFCRDYIFITESPVDAIMLAQHNINAVSQTAGSGNTAIFTKNFSKFSHIKRVFIVYDNDDAGRNGAGKLKDLFGDRAKVFTFPGFPEKFDITDYFKNGNDLQYFMDLVGFYEN